MTLVERFFKAVLPYKEVRRDGEMYLRRHYLSPQIFGRRLFLHLLAIPDPDDAVHDHPWGFYTFVLWGGYIEWVSHFVWDYAKRRYSLEGRYEEVRPGMLRYRPATYIHKVEHIRNKRSWTLVLAGPAEREWGFLEETREGVVWTHNSKYPAPHEKTPWPEDVVK